MVEKNRNGKMWMNSVMYLEDKKGFNFSDVLEKNLYRERSYCMAAAGVQIRGVTGGSSSSSSSGGGVAALGGKKDPYAYECAVSDICPA